jgi:ribosome maturation factor RimP
MSDQSAKLQQIADAVAPVIAELGLSLYDVELSGSGRARNLRVMIDRPTGIDLEAIAAATEAVSPVLDQTAVDRVLSGPYSLEVSSPGLERPLRTPAHFARAVGETISVKAAASNIDAPAEGDEARVARSRVRGVVQSAGDDSFTLLADDGTEHTISYAEVVQARTVFEWGPEPKGGKAKATNAKTGKAKSAKGRKQEVVRR